MYFYHHIRQCIIGFAFIIIQIGTLYAQSDTTINVIADQNGAPLLVANLTGTWYNNSNKSDSIVISEVYNQLIAVSYVSNHFGYYLFLVQGGLSASAAIFENWGVSSCIIDLTTNGSLVVRFPNSSIGNEEENLKNFTFNKKQ
jgi:hypothetical protein